MLLKALRYGLPALVAIFVLIQLAPYGRAHTNPQTTKEPRWDSPRTRELAAQTCFSCHSNLTDWPWYSSVAPASWLVQRDVNGGRSRLNFSEWDRPQPDIERVIAQIESDSMPPLQYRPLHPEARLSDAQKQELINGLVRTFAQSPHPIAQHRAHNRD